MKKSKRVSKIKKSLQKYQEDLFNYQTTLNTEPLTPKEIASMTFHNEYVTVEEVSEEEEEEEKKINVFTIEKTIVQHRKESINTKGTSSNNITAKGLVIFSHSYLNEQKTHMKDLDHPQGTYNSMKIRK